MSDRQTLDGKRVMALDYGKARLGVAVCDEMHIVVSTRPVIPNDARLWDGVIERIAADRIDVVVVGVPRRVDDEVTEIIAEIERFILELRQRIELPVIEVDEAYSTKRAFDVMHASGMRKKKRSTKGTKDQLAAAMILQDLLDETR